MKKINENELIEILIQHQFWVQHLFNVPFVEQAGQQAVLAGIDLRGVDFHGMDLYKIVLQKCDLTGTNLRGVNLTHANLNETILADADLSGVALGRTNLTHAVIDGVILRGAGLFQADLSYATQREYGQHRPIELQGAYLSRLILKNTDLRGACLRGADLGSKLDNTDVRGADLRGAFQMIHSSKSEYLQKYLAHAIIDEYTLF